MFRYVKLKNYRSLVDIYVDFTGKRNMPRKLILIYGENGIGKTNLASAFYTLHETIKTKSAIETFNSLIEETNISSKRPIAIPELFRLSFANDIQRIISESKTVGSTENMVLEFGFRIKGKNGFYRLETNDTSIVSEHLEYAWNKNITELFDINTSSININDHIFKDNQYKSELINLIDKYWGKHSLLSIIEWEISDKRYGYIENKISKCILNVITFFKSTFVNIQNSNRSEKGVMPLSHSTFTNLEQGEININEIEELKKTEAMINEFFTRLYSDVKRVYYRREEKEDNKIKYALYFKKQLYGKLVDINYRFESTGTRRLLNMLPFFVGSVEQNVVIIDEMDTGIHDLLVNEILANLYGYINGQVIITTHNTMLLETEFAKDSVYIFNVNEKAEKELLPLNSFERIHKNLNVRKRYLQGMYGGIPYTMDIDFDELVNIME